MLAVLVEAEEPDGGVVVLVVAALRGEPRATEGVASAADRLAGFELPMRGVGGQADFGDAGPDEAPLRWVSR